MSKKGLPAKRHRPQPATKIIHQNERSANISEPCRTSRKRSLGLQALRLSGLAGDEHLSNLRRHKAQKDLQELRTGIAQDNRKTRSITLLIAKHGQSYLPGSQTAL